MWLAEVGYDPETATVVLSPSWGTTPQPLGFAPQPMNRPGFSGELVR